MSYTKNGIGWPSWDDVIDVVSYPEKKIFGDPCPQGTHQHGLKCVNNVDAAPTPPPLEKKKGPMRFIPGSFTSQVAASRAEAMLKAAPECAKSGLVVAPDYVTNTSRTIDNICVQPGTPRDNSNAPPPATDDNKTLYYVIGGVALLAAVGVVIYMKRS